MKKNKNIFIGILSFVLLLGGVVGLIIIHKSYASDLVNASDTISAVWTTKLAADAGTGATLIKVVNGSGVSIGDEIFINDSVNNEIRTVANVVVHDIIIDNLNFAYTVTGSEVFVSVLTGIKHSFSFDTSTSGDIEIIRFELSPQAIADSASFAGINFSNINGIAPDAPANHITNQQNYAEFDADGSLIVQGSTVTIDLNNVKNPNGLNSNSYSILINTLDAAGGIIDSVKVFFGTDTGVIVQSRVEPFIQFIVEDDGSKNNSADDMATTDIVLGNANTATLDDAVTGYGVDGNTLVVSTNSLTGYNITIADGFHGLVKASFTGSGRPMGGADDGIDDLAGGPVSWPAAGAGEAYGYSVGTTFDSPGVANNYRAFSSAAFEIKNTAAPIGNEVTYVTIRVQIGADTPVGNYSDSIVYTIVSNL